MHTIGADHGQALCLIGANIVRDYKDEIKYTYETRDTNLMNLIFIMLGVIHLVTLQACDSSREHYFLNCDDIKVRSPSDTYNFV